MRRAQDVLRRRVALDALLSALDDVDRLVLLGDTVELAARSPRRSMPAAAPVLRAIGERLGAEREVVVVPGNHDLALIRPWLRNHAQDVTHDTTVPPAVTPLLVRL